MITSQFIAAIIQLLLFTLIPFIVHLIKAKSYKGFFSATGLYQAPAKTMLLALCAALLLAAGGIGLALSNTVIKAATVGPGTVQETIRALGSVQEKIIVILIISLLKTSLSEELFFRGFIGKLLIAKLGFKYGNLLQAFIFGIVHVLLFLTLSKVGVTFLVFAFLLPAAGGYFAGYLNQKLGKGSVFPGWLMHGLGNVISYSVFAFFI